MYKAVIVKQNDIKDCGAACLLSIIKFYNGNISLDKIRIDSCISKNGITAYNLISAAKKYGFDAKGIRITFDELKKGFINLPAIAYLELQNRLRHYVVIYKIENKYIRIMDPAKGLIKVKYIDFERDFRDVLIILSPISNIVKYQYSNKLIDIFISFIKNEKKLIISLFITSFIVTIISILGSFYFKIIIENLDTNLMSLFYLFVILFLVLTLTKVILTYLKNYFETYLNKNIDIQLIPTFIEHIFKLPLNAISNRTTGEILTRVNELTSIKELFANMFITLSLNLLMAITSCFVLFYINIKLSFILIIIISIYILNNILWLKSINKMIESNINLETIFNSSLTNNLNNIISIKNTNRFSLMKLEENLIKYLDNTFKFKLKISIYDFINNFIMEIGLFILNTIGFIYIMKNNIELIDLITYDSLYLYFINPIKDIVSLIPKYVFIKRSFIKINDFLMLEEEKYDSKEEKFFNGDITFENISFSYNMYDYPIKNYSLKIKEGNKVLVMAKSGAGKSTLFKLLFRLYDPINGNIFINNINIKDYNLNTIRNNICFVSQDEGIFNDTILNNITLKKNISIDKLNNILTLCQINEILNKKSLRLDTLILEDGSNLSGGEKARIIIARALLKDCNIIIFDETFSAVAEDDASEMIKNIFKYYIDKTIILISHFKPKCQFDIESTGDFNV